MTAEIDAEASPAAPGASRLDPTALRRRAGGDPDLIDVVRAASVLARAEAEVVVFEGGRAVICSNLGRDVLQPRPLHEAELRLTGGVRHASDGMVTSVAIGDPGGSVVGALTVTAPLAPAEVDALHALARVAWRRFTEPVVGGGTVEVEVLDHLRDAVIVVDGAFTVTYATRSTGTLLGRTPDELLGTNAVELVHPEDLEVAFDAIARLSEGREVYRTVVRLRHASGDYARIEVTGTDAHHVPGLAGTVLSLRSGDRDLELAEALDRERHLMAAIVDQLHDGVVAVDRFGEAIVVNRVARRMYEAGDAEPSAEIDFERVQVLDAGGRPLDPTERPVARVRRGSIIDGDELTIIGAGGATTHVDVSSRPILGSDGASFGTVLGLRDVTVARRAERELRERALHDPLTGLANRRSLQDHLARLIGGPDTVVAMCFIDLDGFKTINDSFGHRAGDHVIRSASSRLARVIAPDQLLARTGGDEFVVVAEVSGDDEALALAERLGHCVEPEIEWGADSVVVTASVGVAVMSTADLDGDGDELVRRADIAMHAAKDGGRDRVELYGAELARAAAIRARERSLLERALVGDGLVMHFQPIVDAATGSVVGLEALARCVTDDGTVVGPGAFLDTALATGLARELDAKAFDLSCRAAAVIRAAHPDLRLVMACNFAAATLVQPNIVGAVLDVVATHGLDPSDVCIEITESTAFEAGPAVVAALRALRGAGVLLALDDFGTGYSSLSHLRDLPLAKVKVDRSFISRLDAHGSERAISAAIVELAGSLGLDVVAEGVETREQLDHARTLGFRRIQGFFYSPARALDEVIELLAGDLEARDRAAEPDRIGPIDAEDRPG